MICSMYGSINFPNVLESCPYSLVVTQIHFKKALSYDAHVTGIMANFFFKLYRAGKSDHNTIFSLPLYSKRTIFSLVRTSLESLFRALESHISPSNSSSNKPKRSVNERISSLLNLNFNIQFQFQFYLIPRVCWLKHSSGF